MNRTAMVVILGGALLVASGACSSEAYKNAIWARARALSTQPEYVIGNSDTISVRVLSQPDFVVEGKTVRPDGKIAFPTHGDIEVVGKTPQELRAELEKEFVKTLGLLKPKVFVSVDAYESKSVTILGEVRVPGRFPYTGQMRVVDLLGRTIGWDPITAATTQVLIFRDIDGDVKMYHVNVRDFFERGDFTTNFYLRPGDIVWVPPTGWEKVARAIRRVLSPITAIANSIGIGVQTTSYFVPSVGQ
ncbi:MAG: polysaccharide biosynthesis/export family protein [Planctomycetota bacterium]|jgi:polysaccharide export outer membrane protein